MPCYQTPKPEVPKPTTYAPVYPKPTYTPIDDPNYKPVQPVYKPGPSDPKPTYTPIDDPNYKPVQPVYKPGPSNPKPTYTPIDDPNYKPVQPKPPKPDDYGYKPTPPEPKPHKPDDPGYKPTPPEPKPHKPDDPGYKPTPPVYKPEPSDPKPPKPDVYKPGQPEPRPPKEADPGYYPGKPVYKPKPDTTPPKAGDSGYKPVPDRKTDYTVELPAHHAAVLYGAATAGWKQHVTVIVDDVAYAFQGINNSLLNLQNLDGGNVLTIKPAAADRKIYLAFSADHPGGSTDPSSLDFKETIIPNYATYYTFYTEDGFDTDHHDTVFTVGIIPVSKAGFQP